MLQRWSHSGCSRLFALKSIFTLVKRIPLLLTLGFFLLVAGGITLYQYFLKKNDTTVWNLIPEQTVLVYEVDDCNECVIETEKSVIAKTLGGILLDFPDSVKRLLEILYTPKKGNVVSLHVISKADFDVIYYFSQNQGRQFENTISSWKAGKGIKFSERELNESKILEFTFGKRTFSCVQLDGIWVGSFTPFLVEDVVRTFTSDERSIFTNKIADVYTLPRIKGDAGNFYIHLKNFTNWLRVFSEKAHSIPDIGKASLLDIKHDKNSLTLNGFTIAPIDDNESVLSRFGNQSPVQFGLKQYISTRTVFATHYGISDGSKLYKNLALSKNKSIQDTLVSLVKINFENLFSLFGDEMSLCYQESKNGSFSKIILFNTEKPEEWLRVFDQLSKATEKEDTVFYEKYSTYEIREIEMNDLPGKLFSPLTSGFKQTYYTWIGNTIILSEQLEGIKYFVDDIDQENVWGKSVAFNKFTESTLLESNVSVYINTPLLWNTISHELSPRWKKFVVDNHLLLRSFDFGAIQFSHLNESFYTNVTWTYSDESALGSDQQIKRSERLVASLSSSIIGDPIVLKSHVDRKDEVLVQDSLNILYHFSNAGKVLWQVALDGPIIGEIQQVDFYKNGKLQFFFATSKKLHVVDRLGNYVAPFPVGIKTKEIEFVSVVDYDNSKKYRFLLADKSGKLWMYDKDGQNLEGWKPRNVESGLSTEAKHHRIRGKDYIVAVRKDGWAYLMNRRGENIKGFPLNLDARPEGEYFVEMGNSVATTNFVCISKDGFRVKFSLEGKLLSRETLVKPSFETQFALIAEQNGKSYVIKRQDGKRLTILNEEGVELFSNDFVGSSPVSVQYYDFGAGRVYISVTDLSQDISFIYNGKGNLLNTTPIEGSSIELRASKSDFPKTYVVDGNALIIQ
jgi:hypothetical protein